MVSSLSNSLTGLASGGLWDMAGRVRVTTFIGAGGKTTCLKAMTREFGLAGLQVIATTTTKVYPEADMKIWKNPYSPPPDEDNAWFWYAKIEASNSGKWLGPALNVVDDAIAADQRFWVIEGDGARGHKLKCWGSHEPQIPLFSDCAVLVVDRGLWGKVLQKDQIHRPELSQDLIGNVWNAEKAWNYFLKSPVFAPQYRHMTWVILLNSCGVCTENKELVRSKNHKDQRGLITPNSVDSHDLLRSLSCRWAEIEQDFNVQNKYRPKRLRLAAGDAKEGKLLWFDLW
ncbi:MAG: selenium cofactor biosynthesis protein YqeC [Bacillota bacterium]|nr:selenium cofactor biosynthesis protein YqeC [Bacillota bacterium]